MSDLSIHPGAYGGLSYRPRSNSFNYPLVQDYGFDWMWFNQDGIITPMMQGNEQVIHELREMSKKARIIYSLWPWRGERKGCDSIASLADPILTNKDWLDLAEDQKCFEASLNGMIRQLELFDKYIGFDGLYGVSISEEEPEVGMGYGRGFEVLDKIGYEGAEKIIGVYNRFFDRLKELFGWLKIAPSFYPCFYDGRRGKLFTDEQFSRIKRDFIVMDAYPADEPSVERYIESWNILYPPTTETYIILWGCGSIEKVGDGDVFEGYSRWGREKDNAKILQINEAFLRAGYTNLGWFGLGWTSPVRDKILAWADEHRAEPWSDKKSPDWKRMLTTRFETSKELCEKCLPLLSSHTSQSVSNRLKEVEKSLSQYSDSFNLSSYKQTSAVLWSAISAILDEAGERSLRMDKSLDLQESVKIFDEFKNFPKKLPNKKELHLMLAKSSMIETVAEFLSESASVADIIKEMLSLLKQTAANLLQSKNVNDYLRTELHSLCQAVDTNNIDKCNLILKRISCELVKAGLIKKVIVQVAFGNPYSYYIDARPIILCRNNSDQWKEIYRGTPLDGHYRLTDTVECQLDEIPSEVRIDNGNWTGSFRVHDVQIITNNGVFRPVEVRFNGNVTNAQSILEQNEGFAEIYHVGKFYEEDFIEASFNT